MHGFLGKIPILASPCCSEPPFRRETDAMLTNEPLSGKSLTDKLKSYGKNRLSYVGINQTEIKKG